MIEPEHRKITVSRQCELLGLSRASYYYESNRDDSYNELIMNLIDEQFTKTPFYGVPRITESLRIKGHQVNRKRICLADTPDGTGGDLSEEEFKQGPSGT